MVEALEGEPSPKLVPVHLEDSNKPVEAFGFFGSSDTVKPPLLMIPEGAKVGDSIGMPIERLRGPDLKFFQISAEDREGLTGRWLTGSLSLRKVMVRRLVKGGEMPRVYVPAVGDPEKFKDFMSLFIPGWLPAKSIEMYELPQDSKKKT